MSKRLNDTAALKSQGIKEAGIELASDRSLYSGRNRLEPAYQSADYAVGKKQREKEQDKLAASCGLGPFVAVNREEHSRKTGAGNSSLSAAVKVARGE